MNAFLKQARLIIFLVICINASSQDYHVRIGFIGNSITAGAGLPNPAVDAYPSQIGVLLKEKYGDTCIITNYAVSGRTMLKHGDFPIWKEPLFQTGWNYAPDICFIMLGTNDSKPYNWEVCGSEFYTDYLSMIDTFKLRNPRTKFIVCRPDPAFAVLYDIRDSVIKNFVIPLVDSIAKVTDAVEIDFYNAMLDSVSVFPDKIHPNQRGAKAMAKVAFNKIVESDIIHKVEKGYTLVTSLKSNIVGELRIKDSATISWTTVNATEVFLNGKKVSINGSLKVAPNANTSYVLKAIGSLSSDSLTFEQKVYKPALTKVYTYFTPTEIHQSDTILAVLVFFDQKNKKILDTVFDINWTLIDGYGRFVNKGNNLTKFIADSLGNVKMGIVINNTTYNASFTVIEKITTVIPNKNIGNLKVFPNPINNEVYFNLKIQKPEKISIRITDMNGRLCINEIQKLQSVGEQILKINTANLVKGNYVYELEYNGNRYSGKIVKE